MSLVGPRPERQAFVAKLQERIPFYQGAAAGQAGADRLGAGDVRVRQLDGGRPHEAAVRPLLHQAPVALPGPADRTEDDWGGAEEGWDVRVSVGER